jgi:hypothetical protein
VGLLRNARVQRESEKTMKPTMGEHGGSWRIHRFNARPSEASQSYQLGEREALDLANRDGFDTVFEMILCLMK